MSFSGAAGEIDIYIKKKKKIQSQEKNVWGQFLTHGLITRTTRVPFLFKFSWQMLTQWLTITIKVTKNKSSHNNNNNKGISFFCISSLLNTGMPTTGIIYSTLFPPQTHTGLSASGGEVRRGQWGRLLDSEVLLWRGVLWPFMQPLWRFIPPFRMSWMCWTIKLMATARNMEMVDKGTINLITWDKRK